MITNLERKVNIINEAYKRGYKFPKSELEMYNREAVQILDEAEIPAIEGCTKEALTANLLMIDDNGLEDEIYNDLQGVEIDAEAYICENAPIYAYEKVDMSWGKNQNFIWCDEFGYEFWQSGEIVGDYDWKYRYYKNEQGEWERRTDGSSHDEDFAEGAIFLDKICDSLARVIQLYC